MNHGQASQELCGQSTSILYFDLAFANKSLPLAYPPVCSLVSKSDIFKPLFKEKYDLQMQREVVSQTLGGVAHPALLILIHTAETAAFTCHLPFAECPDRSPDRPEDNEGQGHHGASHLVSCLQQNSIRALFLRLAVVLGSHLIS